jgi:hypothetical protein
MASRRGESNTGLVVVLVFFILLSLGLGVATYYGFSQQNEKEQAAKKAQEAAKAANDERDWYQYQAWLYRTYIGETKNLNDTALGVARTGYASGKFAKAAGTEADDVKTLITATESKPYKIAREDKDKRLVPQDVTMAWNEATKRPTVNFQEVVDGQQKMIAYQEQQTVAALKAQKAAEDEKKTAMDNANKKIAEYDGNYKALSDKFAADLATARQETEAQRADNEKVREDMKAVRVKADEEKALVLKGEGLLKTKIKDLESDIDKKNQQIALAKKQAADAPINGETIKGDVYITQTDPTGKKPFVNIGSADNVKPQLTFSLHGIGPDGKPLAESKGSLEIVNILGPHLSQAEIRNVKADKDGVVRNPVVKGDVLYNGVWSATAERHVAIAGKVLLRGEKKDSLDELLRLLQRQGVVVDAYLDPADNAIKKDGQEGGKVTGRTDFLILGEGLEEAKDAYKTGVDSLRKQASENGVPIMPMRKFLESIGYVTP